MKSDHIVRAWKDPSYRKNLSDAERAALPENPAGLIELSDSELGVVAGGFTIVLRYSVLCLIPTVFCSINCLTVNATICHGNPGGSVGPEQG